MPKKTEYSLGIDLGGTKIAAGVCDNGQILNKVIFPTNPKLGLDGIIATISEAVSKLLTEYDSSNISGIGIGAAGQIDSKSGSIIYAPNLKLSNVPLAKQVQKKTGFKVKVLNDVRAATLAEMKYGNGKGLKNFVNIFVGTGIGSGIVANGKLLQGSTNTAGEIGHTCLNPKGPECGCGKRGCLEAYASGTGIENYIKSSLMRGRSTIISDMLEGNIDGVSGPIIREAASKGDKLALEAVERVGKYLGIAIANVHTLLNPDVVLLGGGMMAFKEYFMPKLLETVGKHILPVANTSDEIIKEAKFEKDAVLIGASAIF